MSPSSLCLAIHGPTPESHELHTGRPGDFERVMRALAGARAQRRPVVVVSWLTRSSCRSLVALVDRLVAYQVAGWAIVWPRVESPAPPEASRTVPRLGIAVPHALRAVQRAQRAAMAVAMVGVPLCTLGPFVTQRLPVEGAAGRGAYPPVCAECPVRAQCPGVDPWYLDRFGSEELHAISGLAESSLAGAQAEDLARAVNEVAGSA